MDTRMIMSAAFKAVALVWGLVVLGAFAEYSMYCYNGRSLRRWQRCVALMTALTGIVGAVSILTGHNNVSRTGTNASETILTPTTVGSGRFHKLGSYAVDGTVYGQPLYVPSITVSGTVYNLLIVTTGACTVYAFDADTPGSAALWTRSLCTPFANQTASNGTSSSYNGPFGILATPVVDVALNSLFVVGQSSTPTHILGKITLTTGALATSTTITASVAGTGDPGTTHSSAEIAGTAETPGTITFNSSLSNCRADLAITAGNVYVGCGSKFDGHPWHGWLISYDEATLTQQAVWCASPNAWGGGIWHGGVTVDGSGNLFVLTGNGAYDGVTSFGFSAIKFNSSLVMQDWYSIPAASLNAYITDDRDFGSTEPILIDGTNLIVWAEKAKNAIPNIYSVDTTCMGHQGGTVGGCPGPQNISMALAPDDYHSGAYSLLYIPGVALFAPTSDNQLKAYTLSGSTWNTTPVASFTTGPWPGHELVGSSNGTSTPIAWAVTSSLNAFTNPQDATLHAYDAVTFKEIWNSNMNTADRLGGLPKFTIPQVANGRVYMGVREGLVVVYGLTPQPGTTGNVRANGNVRVTK